MFTVGLQCILISGTPSEKIWPGYSKLPGPQKMKFVDFPVSNLRSKFTKEMLSDKGLDFLKRLLTYDPKRRLTCDEALQHSYFDEAPVAIDPSMFPTWPAKSEGKIMQYPYPVGGLVLATWISRNFHSLVFFWGKFLHQSRNAEAPCRISAHPRGCKLGAD